MELYCSCSMRRYNNDADRNPAVSEPATMSGQRSGSPTVREMFNRGNFPSPSSYPSCTSAACLPLAYRASHTAHAGVNVQVMPTTVSSATYSMTLLSRQTLCHRHTASVLPARKPLRTSAVKSRSVSLTERHRCRVTSSSRGITPPVAAQSTNPPTPQLAVTSTQRQPVFFLSTSQLANRQVVTRTEGRILGVVDHLIAEPNTCKVVALNLKASSDILPGEPAKQLGLMSLKQVSDVLLVHDDRAILQQQLTVGAGYVKVVGTVVKTADGKTIGKVVTGCPAVMKSPSTYRLLLLAECSLSNPACMFCSPILSVQTAF